MFFSISYWALAGILALAWLFHILLSIKPSKYLEYEWDIVKQMLVAQANRIFYLLLELPIAWIGHNIFIADFSLMFIVWIVRLLAALTSIKQLIFFVIGLFSLRDVGGIQTTFSNLIVALVSALITLSI